MSMKGTDARDLILFFALLFLLLLPSSPALSVERIRSTPPGSTQLADQTGWQESERLPRAPGKAPQRAPEEAPKTAPGTAPGTGVQLVRGGEERATGKGAGRDERFEGPDFSVRIQFLPGNIRTRALTFKETSLFAEAEGEFTRELGGQILYLDGSDTEEGITLRRRDLEFRGLYTLPWERLKIFLGYKAYQLEASSPFLGTDLDTFTGFGIGLGQSPPLRKNGISWAVAYYPELSGSRFSFRTWTYQAGARIGKGPVKLMVGFRGQMQESSLGGRTSEGGGYFGGGVQF